MRAAAERARTNSAAEPLYQQADIDFHRAIIRAAGNRPLARMAEPIHRALTATFAALARPQTRFERGLPEHARILEAIRGRRLGRGAAGDAGAPADRRGLPARARRGGRRERGRSGMNLSP